MLSQICLSVVCRPNVRAPYSGGLTFRGFFHYRIRQLTHQKLRRSSKVITPSEQISLTGVWMCDSSKVANLLYHQVTFGYLIS